MCRRCCARTLDRGRVDFRRIRLYAGPLCSHRRGACAAGRPPAHVPTRPCARQPAESPTAPRRMARTAVRTMVRSGIYSTSGPRFATNDGNAFMWPSAPAEHYRSTPRKHLLIYAAFKTRTPCLSVSFRNCGPAQCVRVSALCLCRITEDDELQMTCEAFLVSCRPMHISTKSAKRAPWIWRRAQRESNGLGNASRPIGVSTLYFAQDGPENAADRHTHSATARRRRSSSRRTLRPVANELRFFVLVLWQYRASDVRARRLN